MSNVDEDNTFLINLINYQVKTVSRLSVIAKNECFRNAQMKFSKQVNLYNSSMQETRQSSKTFLFMLKVIRPDVVFIFEKDDNACRFADYAKIKTTHILTGDGWQYSDTMLVKKEVPEASKYIVDALEKNFSLDFYPKYYLQSKAVMAQMTVGEIVEAIFRRKRRVETAFEKEWGYSLPVAPKTYNELLNRNKTLSSYKRYKKYTDKYKAIGYMRREGHGNLLPDILGLVKFSLSQKLWDSLPNQFVIKPTNSSGYNIVVNNKSSYNLQSVNQLLRYIKNVHYGLLKNEPVYSFWNSFLITEYISGVVDYKFFCFSGKVKFVAVVNELSKESEHREPYQMITDKNFCELPFSYGYERGNQEFEKPSYFNEMIDAAEKLAKKFPYVRIDMMGNQSRFYFGEFTFFPGGGRDRFTPSKYDKLYGEMVQETKNGI